MGIIIENKIPDEKEYITLRKSIGWNIPSHTGIVESLSHALHTTCIRDNGKLIGMGRIIGDGGLYFYIQDLMVLPEFQGKGHGRAILNELMSYLTAHSSSGAFIGIFSGDKSDSLLEKFSILDKTHQHIGNGVYFIRK